MIVHTSKGPIDDSLLSVCIEEATTAAGMLTSKKCFYLGELVKVDQHLYVSEAAMAGLADASLQG